jgi:hypothetical protein
MYSGVVYTVNVDCQISTQKNKKHPLHIIMNSNVYIAFIIDDRHDITTIVLKVVLNIINQTIMYVLCLEGRNVMMVIPLMKMVVTCIVM